MTTIKSQPNTNNRFHRRFGLHSFISQALKQRSSREKWKLYFTCTDFYSVALESSHKAKLLGEVCVGNHTVSDTHPGSLNYTIFIAYPYHSPLKSGISPAYAGLNPLLNRKKPLSKGTKTRVQCCFVAEILFFLSPLRREGCKVSL